MTASQRFVISHSDETAFKTGGLRDYSAYRDLGVAGATGRLAQAHVIRMTAPFRPKLSVRHHHNVQFQMVYCLKGWFETEFEGVGRQRLVAGSSWVQPPGIQHTVVGWSDDCELLELILPAEHETVNDAQALPRSGRGYPGLSPVPLQSEGEGTRHPQRGRWDPPDQVRGRLSPLRWKGRGEN